jgi:hypothetical protein
MQHRCPKSGQRRRKIKQICDYWGVKAGRIGILGAICGKIGRPKYLKCRYLGQAGIRAPAQQAVGGTLAKRFCGMGAVFPHPALLGQIFRQSRRATKIAQVGYMRRKIGLKVWVLCQIAVDLGLV